MSRQAIAAEALSVSRAIWAAVPMHVRVASIVQAFLRQAFTKDDLYLSMGLQTLVAMEKAGTPGDIEGSTIDELRPLIKRNALSQLKKYAIALGRRVYAMSMAKSKQIAVSTLEEAWHNYASTFQRHPLGADKNVGQALKFISTGFTNRIRDLLDKQTGHGKARQESGAEIGETVHREHEKGPNENAIWHEIERKFKSDPQLLGPKGEPWAWLLVEGKAGGMTENQIIDAWNEASRNKGGDGEVTRSMFLRWKNNPERQRIMKKLISLYADEGSIADLKLAASRGALDTVLMLPSERDLLALFV